MDITKAKQLLERGFISPETFSRAYGEAPIVDESAMTPVGQVRSQGELDRRAAQRSLLHKQQTDVAKKEIEQAEKDRLAAEKAALLKAADEARRADFARKAGISEDVIASRLPTVAEKQQNKKAVAEKPQVTPPLVTDQKTAQQPALDQNAALNAVASGYDLQEQALALAGLAGAARAKDTAAYYENLNKDIDKARVANEEYRSKQLDAIAAQEKALGDEVTRVSKLSIDPNRFWNSKDTPEKIIAHIGLFLGAFGGAAGRGNHAAEMIEKAITRDVEEQTRDIAHQGDMVTKRRGLLSDMRESLRDTMAAKDAVIAAYLQNAQLKVAEISNRYDEPGLQAKAAQLIGEIEVKKQEALGKAKKELSKLMPVDPNVIPQDAEDRKRFVPGYGLALTEKDAQDAKEIVSDFDSIRQNIAELQQMANSPLSSVSNKDRERAGIITSYLTALLRKPVIGSALSTHELDLLNSMIKDPTKVFSLSSSNKIGLKTLLERLQATKETQLKYKGLKSPNKVRFTPTEK